MTNRWISRRLPVEGTDAGVTVHTCVGADPGPRVLVLGGVHGNEVGGIVAAGGLIDEMPPLRRGTVTIVPVAHEAAHHADSRVSPLDGGNLARSFPGDPTGGPTSALAAMIDAELIAHHDVLIDLHTSDGVKDMPLFAGCLDDGSPAADRATELAVAFGLGMVWTHPELAPGRTLTVAHQRGIPAVYVESPAGGVLSAATLHAYRTGVLRALRHLDLIDTPVPTGASTRLWLHDAGDTDAFSAAPVDGFFIAGVELLDRVEAGRSVGHLVDVHGRRLATVDAARNGYVATLQRHAAVRAGDPTVGVAAPRPQTLGLASDGLYRTSIPDSADPPTEESTALPNDGQPGPGSPRGR